MNDLAKLVEEVADLYARLQVSLTPFAAVGGESRRSKPTSRPPVRLEVSDLITEVDTAAHESVAQVRTALGHNLRRESTPQALRALPALVKALPAQPADPHVAALPELTYARLERAASEARSILGLGKPRIHLGRCPYCEHNTLVADPHAGVAWCRNRDACGYICERPGCWCDADDPRRWHRYRWLRDQLVSLALLLEQTG